MFVLKGGVGGSGACLGFVCTQPEAIVDLSLHLA